MMVISFKTLTCHSQSCHLILCCVTSAIETVLLDNLGMHNHKNLNHFKPDITECFWKVYTSLLSSFALARMCMNLLLFGIKTYITYFGYLVKLICGSIHEMHKTELFLSTCYKHGSTD